VAGVPDVALLSVQAAPPPAWHEADADAIPWPAATVLVAPHSPPPGPAAQSALASARVNPWRLGTSAVPAVSMWHPMPVQLAPTSARPSADSPPELAEQVPGAEQIEVDRPRTPGSPAATTSVVDDVWVAQPVVLPSPQNASTVADEVANRSSGRAPADEEASLKPAEITAVHAAVPVHAVPPVAVLRLGVPSPAVAPPLRVAVQPASGQTVSEFACPLMESTDSRAVEASLCAAHPEAAAVQVAVVCDPPPTPLVAPVAAATQPGPAHCADPSERLVVAGAPVTGLPASSAASDAAPRACSACAATSAAAFFCSAVASARLATSAASAA
jgi:hypothetical protein